MLKPIKMPKTLGATIDLLYTVCQQRLDAEKVIEAMKEQEATIRDYLMSNFEHAGLEGAKGSQATASLRRSTVADVTDWGKLWTYISKTKSWDLVQKRVSVTACRERWDASKQIPGVEPKEIVALSLTKVGAK